MRKKSTASGKPLHFEGNPLWYKDAVIYEVHVRAFFDSNNDGVGDFKGLTQKLDYLQDLGVNAIWLLPFYPSPLRDDGYDISDYTDIHPSYGNLRDFRAFIREANRRNLHVISELVLNHTSDQHPWFQRARRAKPGSNARNYYVWSKTPERYQDTRIIFKDFESSNWTYDPTAGEYFWHRFYSHQPDLNFENPNMRRALLRVIDFWLEMGIAGVRLDAIPYLYEEEGTNCENLPQTHAFLKELRRHVDRKFPSRMFLAEANMWPEDAAAYFGEGDECHMNFHFPLMPRMFMALHLENRFPIIDILQQTPEIPDNAQWAVFLRNHDELTLEMVTDEERDYMYRVYARDPTARINLGIRRRLAPLLGNNRRKIELLNALLFSLPGTPVIYYGDEIGMGDNVFLGDRNGVRTPMQWSADRNAGFSKANPQQLYLPVIADPEYRFEAINVETQSKNPHSLLWWMKRLIGLRKRYKAFSRGSMEILHPENHKVLVFIRRYEGELLLCVINLSRFVQYLELNLGEFEGMTPIELFGMTPFPRIGRLPYFLTLGPHSFYFFSLEMAKDEAAIEEHDEFSLPTIEVEGNWESVFTGKKLNEIEDALFDYLPYRRWFGGKAKSIKSIDIIETMPIHRAAPSARFALVSVDYTQDTAETYLLVFSYVTGDDAARIQAEQHESVIARLRKRDKNGEIEEGVIFEALSDTEFCSDLFELLQKRRRFKGAAGKVQCVPTRFLRQTMKEMKSELEPSVVKAEQSNTSIIYGDQFVLKLFRRLEEGVNPDLEISRFLTEKHSFENTPRLAGYIEYHAEAGEEPLTLGIMQQYIHNQGDAWSFTLDQLEGYFDNVIREALGQKSPEITTESFMDLLEEEIPQQLFELAGSYSDTAALIGQRVAEMHLVLGSEPKGAEAFSAETFPPHYQRSLFQSMRNLYGKNFPLLKKRLSKLPENVRPLAQEVVDREKEVLDRFHKIVDKKVVAKRIRCHGDLHLGQMLFTGRDFMILDFEGEPLHSLTERRIKRSPLRDVGGMLRSFHYASYTVFQRKIQEGFVSKESREEFEQWTLFWYRWIGRAFLKSYLDHIQPGGFLPRSSSAVETLLDIYLLEKAIYELSYEINNRPDWVEIPLKGILLLLNEQKDLE